MCTLSVITREGDYLLAMNRDERIARGAGEPPKIHQFKGGAAVYPSEGVGGTWIAANEYGIGVALLNLNVVVRRSPNQSKIRSRGQIIPALAGSGSLAELQTALGALELQEFPPFRLVGVFPGEKSMGEWCWNSSRLTCHPHEWRSRHWFSSSLSDRRAENLRGARCCQAQQESDAGSVPWLRRLHGSHLAGAVAFSLCVHREDVQTLSYSEIAYSTAGIEMGHFRGSPCTMSLTRPLEHLRIARPGSAPAMAATQ